MRTIKVIIERGDAGFSAYTVSKFATFALFGFGDSVESTIADFKMAYSEIQVFLKSVPNLQFDFQYKAA
jgi:hypothetical protein